MKLNNDYDDYNFNTGRNISTAGVICILAMLTVIAIVFATNKSKTVTRSSVSTISSTVSASESVSSTGPVSFADTVSSDITVSDLDFYKMYPKEEASVASEVTSVSESSVEEVNETNDGKHTKITWQDGQEEWVAINAYIAKNNFDTTSFINRSGIMEYYENGKVTSEFGIDISKDNDYIDFTKLAKAGCKFVMVRVGARGYQTGTLSIDDYFSDNVKRANDAGIKVGVYFISQAITEEEAEEEAALVLENISNVNVTYPIAYVMQYTENEVSRVESLSKSDKTMIARAFLKKIKEAGYNTVLYGSKLWLIKYIDLARIASDFDIWLSQTDTGIPDFPYKFSMWQYNKNGTIDGVSGSVNFNICLVDYSIK